MKTILSLRKHAYLKTIGAFLIVVALIFGVIGCEGAGNGDGDNPPSQEGEIRTWYDLDAIRDNLDGNYTLMNNLDFTTSGYEELASPIANQGEGWQPIGTYEEPFTGLFDGQEYEIRNLFIDRPGVYGVGLFGVTGEAFIKNVVLVKVDVTGSDMCGGVVGEHQGTLTNSHSTGTVTGETCVGGLVGINDGTVGNSYFSGYVASGTASGGLVGANGGIITNSYSTGTMTGETCVGGLTGDNIGTVRNCYSTGNVTGESYVGGLSGFSGGIVRNSYATGNVTGYDVVGGLLGDNTGTETHSFWDTETSGMEESAGGIGKTTVEMQDIITFSEVAWDIIAVALNHTNLAYTWNIVNNVTYPFLNWEPVS